MTAAGSFLDGGPSRPIQRAAIEVLEPSRADQECAAVRREFAAKQRMALDRLGAMGVRFPQEPQGTFYAFGSIEDLPDPLDDGERFMRAGFAVKVLTVPGCYFDVDPRRERSGSSRVAGWVRFSFGPPRSALETGLDRLAAMVSAARTPAAADR
jgi:aspartate/methionine/tyrosine aminotransferase